MSILSSEQRPTMTDRRALPVETATIRGEGRVAELDGLRGIAILLVVILHVFVRPHLQLWNALAGSSVTRLFDMAWCGVDIFFVLSGFLIGGIILDYRKSSLFYKSFYLRRTSRIFPPYFLLLALASLSLGFHERGEVPFVAYATFTANFWTSAGSRFTFWLGPLWSICIEEQFYLLAPVTLRRLCRRAIPIFLATVIVASAGCRSLMSHGILELSLSYWDFTLTRLDGLGLGVLAAWSVRSAPFCRWARAHTGLLRALFWVLLVMSACCSQLAKPLLLGPGILCISATAFVAILVLRFGASRVLSRVLRDSVLVRLGRYSYFLYLFHLPALWLTHRFLVPPGPIYLFAMIGIDFLTMVMLTGVAALSWRYFEAPIVRRGRRIPYRPVEASQPTELSEAQRASKYA